MREGTIISREELAEQGWLYVHSFGYSEIWGKGTDRILWNPKEKKVQMWYHEENYLL